jgi:hypothetical protein
MDKKEINSPKINRELSLLGLWHWLGYCYSPFWPTTSGGFFDGLLLAKSHGKLQTVSFPEPAIKPLREFSTLHLTAGGKCMFLSVTKAVRPKSAAMETYPTLPECLSN